MRPVGVIAAIVGLATANVPGTVAQRPPPVGPGQRVRVSAPALGWDRQIVRVGQVGSDSIELGDTWASWESLASVEGFAGRRGNTVLGLAIGAAAGGVIGWVVGTRLGAEGGGAEWDVEGGAVRVVLGAAGAVCGGLLGAGVGALIKTDRWEEVPLDRLRVSLVPRRHGGLGLGLSVSF